MTTTTEPKLGTGKAPSDLAADLGKLIEALQDLQITGVDLVGVSLNSRSGYIHVTPEKFDELLATHAVDAIGLRKDRGHWTMKIGGTLLVCIRACTCGAC